MATETEPPSVTIHPVEGKEVAKSGDDALLTLTPMVSVEEAKSDDGVLQKLSPMVSVEEAKSGDGALLKLSPTVSVVLGRERGAGGTDGAASDDGRMATMNGVVEETSVFLLVEDRLDQLLGVDDRTNGYDHTARGGSLVVAMSDGGIPEEEGNGNEGDGGDGEDTAGQRLAHPVGTVPVGIHPSS